MVTRLDRLGLDVVNRLIVPYATAQTQGAHLTHRREGAPRAETNAKQRVCMRYREVLVLQAEKARTDDT
jgi:hypothetical protein